MPETLFSGFVDLMFSAYARVAGETVFSSWMLDFAQQQFKSARLSREVATVSIQLSFFSQHCRYSGSEAMPARSKKSPFLNGATATHL